MTGELYLGGALRWSRDLLVRKSNEDALSGGDVLAEFRGLSWRDWWENRARLGTDSEGTCVLCPVGHGSH